MSFYFIEIDQKLNWSLNSNLGGIRFGIDADGNYGYKKVGADTVIPFIRDINIGDKFSVSLTGSHNLTTTASVCYIDKTTICLFGDISLGIANWPTQCNYIWNYSININGKEYIGTCRIPELKQLSTKCAGYRRDFHYWTSTIYDYDRNYALAVYTNSYILYAAPGETYNTIPFIEITL